MLLFDSHLGMTYDRHEVDVVDRSNRAGLLGALNPALRVPTLVLDDDRVLAESGREFLVGERYSAADIALYAYTHVADEGGFDLARSPAIGDWIDRVAGRPGHVPITA